MVSNSTFSHLSCRIANVLTLSALALGLAACDKMKEPTTVGQRSIDTAFIKTKNMSAGAPAEGLIAMARTSGGAELPAP